MVPMAKSRYKNCKFSLSSTTTMTTTTTSMILPSSISVKDTQLATILSTQDIATLKWAPIAKSHASTLTAIGKLSS